MAKSLKTISSEQMHWSCQGKATWGFYFIWCMFWGVGGAGGPGGPRGEWGGGHGDRIGAWLWWVWPQSLSVFLLGVLELWMCRGLHYCCGQWNMLKCTHSFTALGVWPRAHIHAGKKRHDKRTLHVYRDCHCRKTLHFIWIWMSKYVYGKHRTILKMKMNMWLHIDAAVL